MPANVTVEFEKARIKYEQANSPQAKLDALLEMQRYAPKHKGGENLRAEISKKIAKEKVEIEKHRMREAKKGSAPSLSVRKEGAGQVVIAGMPNSGKSWLLKQLTAVDVEIAPYPFTTKKPFVGMMNYKGAKIQLVEVPALVKGSAHGKATGGQIMSIIRNADAIILLSRNKDERTLLETELAAANIRLNSRKPNIEIGNSKFKGITISGRKFLKIKESEFVNFFKSRGIFNASVILREPTDIETVVRALDERTCYKKAIHLNAFEKINMEKLRKEIFTMLDKKSCCMIISLLQDDCNKETYCI